MYNRSFYITMRIVPSCGTFSVFRHRCTFLCRMTVTNGSCRKSCLPKSFQSPQYTIRFQIFISKYIAGSQEGLKICQGKQKQNMAEIFGVQGGFKRSILTVTKKILLLTINKLKRLSNDSKISIKRSVKKSELEEIKITGVRTAQKGIILLIFEKFGRSGRSGRSRSSGGSGRSGMFRTSGRLGRSRMFRRSGRFGRSRMSGGYARSGRFRKFRGSGRVMVRKVQKMLKVWKIREVQKVWVNPKVWDVQKVPKVQKF